MSDDFKVEMTPLEELDEEAQNLVKRTMHLRQTNSILVGQIESMGGELDLLTPKLEFFMTALVSLGVITDKQVWSIHEQWELTLRDQVKPLRDELQADLRKKQAAAKLGVKAQARPKLIVPGR